MLLNLFCQDDRLSDLCNLKLTDNHMCCMYICFIAGGDMIRKEESTRSAPRQPAQIQRRPDSPNNRYSNIVNHREWSRQFGFKIVLLIENPTTIENPADKDSFY